MNSWSMMDVLMCSIGQYRIWSCKVVVNSGYAHVQWWSMEGYQICSCVRVVYAMVDTMIYADSIKDAQMS